MKITLNNVTKDFGAGPVLKNISLEIQDRELFFLLGPSGCGKTTLLRLLAGFHPPDQGEIYFDDELVNDLGAHERNTGMVFQNYALWPHLTATQNVGYGLNVRKTDRYERDRRVQEALAMVQMERLGNRFPHELSGGQQQRVALARALVIKPQVLLFDEPLSNLDARLRLELREEIRAIHAQSKITTVYVTHDHAEALSLADRIAVIREGRIEQLATPRSIYRRPVSRFVADFVGETNWWQGTVAGSTPQRVSVVTPVGEFASVTDAEWAVGAPVWLGFRPEAVRLQGEGENRMTGELTSINYLGEREEYRVHAADGSEFKIHVQDPGEALAIGSRLNLTIPASSVLVLPRAS